MYGYRILSFLFAWLIPSHKIRNEFRQLCEGKDLVQDFRAVQTNYQRCLAKLKTKQKQKVIFLVNDNTKWKAQSLYDLMATSKDFEPIILLSLAEKQRNLPISKKIDIINNNLEFFCKKGIECKIGWDLKKDKALSPNKFGADIVFYQQPWGIPKIQKPQTVSKYAITCYIPYFVPNYGILSMDCRTFHKYLYRYYVLNEDWKELYANYMKEFSSNLFAVGHTMLDYFYLNKDELSGDNLIIYAPHWSIKHPKNENNTNYSTFDSFGQKILDYAKSHPEQKWLFKPHPKLYSTLEKTGIMTQDEIEKYYAQWEKIGTTCYDGDYINYFKNSKALITDCGSFLTEYFCTGKPVIHLQQEEIKNIPEPFKKILNTYYKATTSEELYKYLDEILANNIDTKFEERKSLQKELKLSEQYAAKNIIDNLRKAIYG